MTTAFSSITAALVSLLEAAPTLAEQVSRARSRRVPDECVSAISVQFDGADPQRGAITGAPVDWTSNFSIDCYARGSESGDVAVDPLLDGVYQRVMADTTLGGLVQDIGVPTVQAEYDAQEQKTGWVRLIFPVQHRTSNLVLTSP